MDMTQSRSKQMIKLPKRYGTEKLTDQIKVLKSLGSLNQFQHIARQKRQRCDRKGEQGRRLLPEPWRMQGCIPYLPLAAVWW